MEPGRGIQLFRNAQMLNLRSLAAILYSAIRFSRAAFLRSPLRSRALINTQKMATNKPANMATNRAASMSVSCEQSTPKTRTGKLRRCPARKHNQCTNRTLPAKDDSWRKSPPRKGAGLRRRAKREIVGWYQFPTGLQKPTVRPPRCGRFGPRQSVSHKP